MARKVERYRLLQGHTDSDTAEHKGERVRARERTSGTKGRKMARKIERYGLLQGQVCEVVGYVKRRLRSAAAAAAAAQAVEQFENLGTTLTTALGGFTCNAGDIRVARRRPPI